MTEEINPFAHYVYEPEGSLWINEPAYVSGVSPEEWEQAAKTLHALGEFATQGVIVGGEALDLAILDAEERVRIQARRAREEGWEEIKDGSPSPAQAERVRRLIRRYDHLNMAAEFVTVAARSERDRVYAEGYMLGELAPSLEALRDEAGDELRRYKRELGLLED